MVASHQRPSSRITTNQKDKTVQVGFNCLLGKPLNIALGHAAVDTGRRVCYTTAADLAAKCRKAALEDAGPP
jgi:hypothetical protein